MRTVSTILVFSFLLILDINLFSFSTGITGLTKRDGGIGCICHGNHKPAPGVSVFFNGPDSALPGQTIIYRLKLAHGPAVKGGFDVASFAGTIDTVSSDTTLKRQSGELTHRFPKTFVNDTVFWTFKYTAPLIPQYDTLYAVANSVDGSGKPDSADQWNFSENFPIRVGIPIGIINNSTNAQSFSLSQNYPNPFNPRTIINYELRITNYVKLAVFDVLGNLVYTLADGKQLAGKHEIEFDGSNYPSGVYFYSISVDGVRVDTKKMLLIK